jgi:hypothetical protein
VVFNLFILPIILWKLPHFQKNPVRDNKYSSLV